jgi:perosamine synthetase
MAQVRLAPNEIRAVQQVLRSGQLRAGRMVAEFEARFAQAVGARFAVAVSSGTAALDLAYRALLEPGDEVIVPDFTFVATASMVVAAGAKPVFADVDPDTFTLDPADVERRITSRTRALAPVHHYGQPADIAPLARLARRHHLRIVWDAAQAHGARFRQHDVGSFADVVCYSFYPTKNMTTGEGGMLTTSDERLAKELRLLRSHGEEERYLHVRLGFNLRMTDIAGALGLSQLAKLPAALGRRRKNAAILTQGLTGIPGIKTPHVREGCDHAFSLYTVQLDPKVLGMTRDDFQKGMADRGVETAVHYPRPLHRQPIFRRHGTDRDYPVSSRLAETVVSLPVHPGLSLRDLGHIVSVVRDVVALK